jgi:hypothetical protein
VRRHFLEPVDSGNAEHARIVIDAELVALGCVDLFSIKKPDDEHDAVLSSECGLARIVRSARYRTRCIAGLAHERFENVQ